MTAFNDQILYIHIPKCGGTACRHYFKEHAPNIKFPRDHDYPFPLGHIALRDIERFSGRSPESFEVIYATIRNPYHQQLSQWLFWWDRHARGGEHFHDVRAAKYSRLHHWLLDSLACDFHVWYDETVNGETKTTSERASYNDFGGYYRYWLAVDGEIPPNVEVVRFERMAKRIPTLLAERLGVQRLPPMPERNAGPPRNEPREYFSELAMRLVEEKFPWAFEHHYAKWER